MQNIDAILRNLREKRGRGELTRTDLDVAAALRNELEDLLALDDALAAEIEGRTGVPCVGGEQATPDELLLATGQAAYMRISESWGKNS